MKTVYSEYSVDKGYAKKKNERYGAPGPDTMGHDKAPTAIKGIKHTDEGRVKEQPKGGQY